MGDRVFEKLADPSLLARSPIFIFAADALTAYGLTGIGIEKTPSPHYRTRPEYLDLQRAILGDGYIDGLLMSPADAENLAFEEKLFDSSPVTPIVRMNAETRIWSPRHGKYGAQPSRPFTTIRTPEAGRYCDEAMACAKDCKIKLGLYSITLNNDTDADERTLSAYLDFAWDVAQTPDFHHFLEVFLPNMSQPGMDLQAMGEYVADSIVRTMAHLRKRQRPLFIKTVYTTPAVWKALVEFDPTLVIGALGGQRINAKRTLELAHTTTEYGGKVILFGRAIFQEENPRAMCKALRAVLDRQMSPAEAHSAYQRTLRA
ncbi:MAG TPA: hypothetical protein P5569_03825 [Candidatus Latescibacteria bacterium]|nr:hypothetical protein [Candidatus Latescibacterota bacterium]